MTDVRVPDAARIGAVGEGWRVALTTLMNERTAIGGRSGRRHHWSRGAAGQPAGGPTATWTRRCAPKPTATT